MGIERIARKYLKQRCPQALAPALMRFGYMITPRRPLPGKVAYELVTKVNQPRGELDINTLRRSELNLRGIIAETPSIMVLTGIKSTAISKRRPVWPFSSNKLTIKHVVEFSQPWRLQTKK
jgi:hypothetical protein